MWTKRDDTRSDVDQERCRPREMAPGEMAPGVMWTRRDDTRSDVD